MSFTTIEYDFCLKETQRWIDHPLCADFKFPVNTKEVPDYLTKIQFPMDLSTILQKLKNNEYQDSQKWLSDLNLIWTNAMTYNRQGTPHHYLADFLKKKCDKRYKTIPKNENDIIQKKLKKAHEKLTQVLNTPYPDQSLTPRVSEEEIKKMFTIKD